MASILWLSLLLPYPPKGGVSQRSYHLLREVATRHDVHLLAFNQPSLLDSDDKVRTAVRALGEFCAEVTALELPYRSRWWPALRSALSLQPYNVVWCASARMAEAARAACAARHYDAVHFDTIGLAQYLPQVTGRCFLNHHNVESQMMLRRAAQESGLAKKAYFWLEGWKLKRYEEQMCGRFSLNFAVSRLDAERLKTVAPAAAVEVIPNGVDLDYFRPAATPSGDPRSLIFVGGLTWYPNVDAMHFFLAEVWPRLRARDPRLRLTIVGKNPPERLRRLGAEAGGVTFTGFVDDIRPYVDAAGIYVCPIRDGGGTKLKMLDALAMAKPIVAHPVACEGLDVAAGRHVLQATSPEEFVEQILRLVGDAPLRARLAAEGRRLVEARYDFKQIGAKLAGHLANGCPSQGRCAA